MNFQICCIAPEREVRINANNQIGLDEDAAKFALVFDDATSADLAELNGHAKGGCPNHPNRTDFDRYVSSACGCAFWCPDCAANPQCMVIHSSVVFGGRGTKRGGPDPLLCKACKKTEVTLDPEDLEAHPSTAADALAKSAVKAVEGISEFANKDGNIPPAGRDAVDRADAPADTAPAAAAAPARGVRRGGCKDPPYWIRQVREENGLEPDDDMPADLADEADRRWKAHKAGVRDKRLENARVMKRGLEAPAEIASLERELKRYKMAFDGAMGVIHDSGVDRDVASARIWAGVEEQIGGEAPTLDEIAAALMED